MYMLSRFIIAKFFINPPNEIVATASMEELFKVHKPIVYGSKQSPLGLELVGAMDGSPAMGEPQHNR